MNERKNERGSRRKNAQFWTYGPVLDSMMINEENNNVEYVSERDKHDKIQDNNSHKFQTETPLDQSSNSRRPLKYFRTQSESNVSYQPTGNMAKLKRALSSTDLKTRLAGCPKGLLIATEPPKSGQTYRRRSNTDIKTKKDYMYIKPSCDEFFSDGVFQHETYLQKEKETILLELNAVKREREQLRKENERLQEELENRNKVIDHLMDFMKSNLPRGTEQLDTDFDDSLTENSLNRTQSFEKV